MMGNILVGFMQVGLAALVFVGCLCGCVVAIRMTWALIKSP